MGEMQLLDTARRPRVPRRGFPAWRRMSRDVPRGSCIRRSDTFSEYETTGSAQPQPGTVYAMDCIGHIRAASSAPYAYASSLGDSARRQARRPDGGAAHLRQPRVHTRMMDVLCVIHREKHVEVEQIAHGKSASHSRICSLVMSGAPGRAFK